MVLPGVSLAPSSFVFLSAAVGSVVVSLSSDNWLGVWFGLEVNLMSFLPFMLGRGLSMEVESTVKYFLVQVVGSALFLVGGLSMAGIVGGLEVSVISSFWGIVMWFGLLVKLGVAPAHFWVPASLAGVSWLVCFLLSTLQKMVPLTFLVFFCDIYGVWGIWVGGLSSLVGGVGGLNQTQLRPLLGYSSIAHMGWALGGLGSGGALAGGFYFLCYCVVSLGLFVYLSALGVYYLKSFSQAFVGMKRFSVVYFGVFLLSLGGFPPFLVFLGKVVVLYSLCSYPVLIPVYLLGALISLYYYLNLVFSWVMSRVLLGLSVGVDESWRYEVGLSILMSQLFVSFIGIVVLVSGSYYVCSMA